MELEPTPEMIEAELDRKACLRMSQRNIGLRSEQLDPAAEEHRLRELIRMQMIGSHVGRIGGF